MMMIMMMILMMIMMVMKMVMMVFIDDGDGMEVEMDGLQEGG